MSENGKAWVEQSDKKAEKNGHIAKANQLRFIQVWHAPLLTRNRLVDFQCTACCPHERCKQRKYKALAKESRDQI